MVPIFWSNDRESGCFSWSLFQRKISGVVQRNGFQNQFQLSPSFQWQFVKKRGTKPVSLEVVLPIPWSSDSKLNLVIPFSLLRKGIVILEY